MCFGHLAVSPRVAEISHLFGGRESVVAASEWDIENRTIYKAFMLYIMLFDPSTPVLFLIICLRDDD